LLPAFAFRYAAHLRRVAWAIRFRGRGAEHVSSGWPPAKPPRHLVCPADELFPDRRDLLIQLGFLVLQSNKCGFEDGAVDELWSSRHKRILIQMSVVTRL
jgi:hypothetical protein